MESGRSARGNGKLAPGGGGTREDRVTGMRAGRHGFGARFEREREKKKNGERGRVDEVAACERGARSR